MSEECLICDATVKGGASQVSDKGMKTLISASLTRRDGRHDLFRRLKGGVVHVECRKRYTRPSDLNRAAKCPEPSTSGASTSLRSSSTPEFQFKTKCFLCTEIIDEAFYQKQKKRKIDKRRKVYNVRELGLDETIRRRATARNDDWGKAVLTRISTVGDLHAADAKYHEDCYMKFFLLKPTGQKKGRPLEEFVSKAMDEIYQYLDNEDKGQYSINEIMEQITGDKPDVRTVMNRLSDKYGDRITFRKLSAKTTVACFRDVGDQILNDAWYMARSDSDIDDNMRIVKTAAAIIRRDVQSKAYDLTSYPPSDEFLNDAKDMVPDILAAFMNALIPQKKSGKKEDQKRVSISHAIIAAIRPRSFISPILTGISYYIHRKFGSRSLINLVSGFGFCASYFDAQQLELSSLCHPPKATPDRTFRQYVFDNADFNVATLDGRDTFHSLGGIKCITPAQALPKSDNIQRLTTAPAALEVGKLGVLELVTYENVQRKGLKNVVIQDLNVLSPLRGDELIPNLQDTLWMTGKWLSLLNTPGIPEIPEWKGFLHVASDPINAEQSAIIPLAFINSSPSDVDTLYTALKYAAEDAHRQGFPTCLVTMDQPLYLKAREIVASSSDDPILGKVEMILGGFHMLMSYLGCIGQTMAGSGLKELLSCAFAPNSVDKMLNGKSYSRAVRGHLLVQTTLAQIILENVDITPYEKEEVFQLLQTSVEITPQHISTNASLASIQRKLSNELSRLKGNGPTAVLWVQYFEMVVLMKKFIAAQRTGNWEDHMTCAQLMIPYFHASGHFHYAKCTHLYVQDMLGLTTRHPQLKQDFIDRGYFTVNRTGTPMAGVWSDMAIEVTLMCDMKSEGGLTRGRGLSDSVLAKWVGGARTATAICSSLEMFCGVHTASGEQHVEFRASRITRDDLDRRKLAQWLADHAPFAERNCLMSLSTGVIGTSNVNCYKALEIGTRTMSTFVGMNFSEVKQSKKNSVVPLAAMSNTIKVNDEVVVVEPLMIFQRTLIAKKKEGDVEELLQYELAPYPMTLFVEGIMRKIKKSALYDAFPKCNQLINVKNSFTVIDGGFLLHRVKWNTNTTFASICDQYVSYIINHYGSSSAVVFDGYEDTNSTKIAEQHRRASSKTSVDIDFNHNMVATVHQENFLSNRKNKTKLITMLDQALGARGIQSTIAKGDADCSIVRCGLQNTSHSTVVIVGEDIDLLVLLVALASRDANVFFMKAGRGNTEDRLYSSQHLQALSFSQYILFIHSFSGCDTTSAIYGKSKAAIVQCFQRYSNETTNIAKVFYDSKSSPGDIAGAGERMFLLMFQAPPNEHDLNHHRYMCFVKSSAKMKANLCALPPTTDAAMQHSYRVFLQVQQWLGNESLQPESWGWTRKDGGHLTPTKTKAPLAPDSVLNTLFCRCATGCGTRCGCRRAGINCSLVCTNCQGSCTNSVPIQEDFEQLDSEELDLFETFSEVSD